MFRAVVPRVVQAGGAAAVVGASSLPAVAEPLHVVGKSSLRQPLYKSSEVSNGWEDEWGFLDSSGKEIPRPQADVGPVPSKEEVEGVTRDLQVMARHAPLPSQGLEIEESPGEIVSQEISASQSNPNADEVTEVPRGQRVAMPFALSAGGNRLLAQALHLFDTDPEVQRTVFDLATDQNVWEAMLKNPSLKALQTERGALIPHLSAAAPHMPKGEGEKSGSETYFEKIQQILYKAVDVVKDMFKGLFEGHNSANDKPAEQPSYSSGNAQVGVSMFLATLVVIMVVVTRR
eukprot:TRINITY_DN1809_c0_g1_i2.p1 TRINITY_DN1809_c0_g1~~TRINITY_DN1809_c0_g1_i2.p1  ORF type:complete len:289 (-),score=66.63 TRINITY_DN1809_c0_g1_i2:545-1411(-)